MENHFRAVATTVCTAAILGVALTGCSGAGATNSAVTSKTGSDSSSSASSGSDAQSSASASRSAGTKSSAGSSTTGTGSGTAAGTTGSEHASSSLRSGQCTTPHLSASITPGDSTAGHRGVVVVLTNTGSGSCTLQGWTGLSLVGGGSGTQIGAAADFDKSSPHGTVTLAAGGTAHAAVQVAEAGNYDAGSCTPTAADGFRIYPPGEKRALFAADTDFQGCANERVHLLTVAALQPGS